MSLRSRRLVWLLRLMMTWSCSTAPSGAAAFLMSWVTVMSAFDGVGSPEGWLCTRISAAAPSSSAIDSLARVDRGVVDWVGALRAR
jgi:hypothetical protein